METADWDSPYRSVRYSNRLSAVILSIVVAVPIYFMLYLYLTRNRWNDEKFLESSGSLLQGADLEKKRSRWSIAAVVIIFFSRRFIIVLSIVKFGDFFWGQIMI